MPQPRCRYYRHLLEASAGHIATIGGQVTGAGSFVKTANNNPDGHWNMDTGPLAGTVILTNTGNNWAGATTVSAGILQIGDGTASNGSIPNVAVSFSGANTTLKFANPTALSFNSVISGSGNLIKTGTGMLTLGGANTYVNGTTISGGILAIASDSDLGASYNGTMSGVTVTNIGWIRWHTPTVHLSLAFSAPTPAALTATRHGQHEAM